MVWSHLLIFCMVGTIVSWAVIYGIIHSKLNNCLTPSAEPHHTHSQRTSRAGGVGIIFGFIAVFIIFNFLSQSLGEKEYPYEVIFWGEWMCWVSNCCSRCRSSLQQRGQLTDDDEINSFYSAFTISFRNNN